MANEKRLIDANALMAYINKNHSYAGLPMAAHICTMELLTYAPTVDAVEVVHGRWKYYHKQNIAVCTSCSFERDLSANFGKAISCPNCGAKMDGGNEDV